MPNIKPISDLKNYNEILQDVDAGQTVFLTRNGRGRYVLTDIREYEKQQATIQLLQALAEGEQSARERGYVSPEDVKKRFSL